jgi:hypothetical protein
MVMKRGFLQDIPSCVGSLGMLGYEVMRSPMSSVLEFLGPEPTLRVSRQDI